MDDLVHQIAFAACIIIAMFGAVGVIAMSLIMLEVILLYTSRSLWERIRRRNKKRL